MEDTPKKVFISYAREDMEQALIILFTTAI